MGQKETSVTLKIKLSTTLSNDPDNTEETVRFLVEEDLQDLGYTVDSVELITE
jgi:hypothetical protein